MPKYPGISFGGGGSSGGSGGGATWGRISGDIANQPDLKTALDARPLKSEVDAAIGEIGSAALSIRLAPSSPITQALTKQRLVAYRRTGHAISINKVTASLLKPSTSVPVSVDVNVNGVSIFGADKLLFDVGQTIATISGPIAITLPLVALYAEVSIDIDMPGTNASGLIVDIEGIAQDVPTDGQEPIALAIPYITGDAGVGHTLTANSAIWSGDPWGFDWEWLADGALVEWVSGPTYLQRPEDAGKALTVRQRAANAAGYGSSTSTAVLINVPLPVKTADPTISGIAIEDQIVTANVGTWLYGPTFSYQWLVDDVDVPGATLHNFHLRHGDIGKQVKVRITATNASGSAAPVVSSPITVAALPVGWNYQISLPDQSGAIGAATYHVGPGQAMTELTQVPWMTLQPGDTVVIHWRESPYVGLIYLGVRGEEDKWIVIRGEAGPAGQRPQITCAGGQPVSGIVTMPALDGAGCFIIGRPFVGDAPQPYGWKPGYIHITGLSITGARSTNTFYNASGVLTYFAPFSCAVYANPVEHLTLSDNEIWDCNLGLFVNSRNGADAQSRFIHVFGNWFHTNGKVGDFSVHNAYTEALGSIYEYNYMEKLIDGAGGDCIKERSAGHVIRYNYLEANSYCLALRDPDSNLDYERVQTDFLGDNLYSHAFVYGNIMKSDGGTFIGHGDGDGNDSVGSHPHARHGDACVYANIFVTKADYVLYAKDAVVLFEPLDYLNPAGIVKWVVRNNMFVGNAAMEGATPAPFAIFRRPGIADFTSNLITTFLNVVPNHGGYTEGVWAGANIFNGIGLGGLTATTFDPKFVDYAGGNLSVQASSPFFSLTAPIPESAAARDLWPDDVPVFSKPTTLRGPGFPVNTRPVATVRPTITGTAEIGNELSVTLGEWVSASPLTYAIKWVRGKEIIPGETGVTYMLVAADGGKQVSAMVFATNEVGTNSRSTVARAVAVDPRAPANSTVPTISSPTTGGGSLLTAALGDWTNAPDTYTVQWMVDGLDVAGATGMTYQTLGSQAGKNVMLRVTGTNVYGDSLPAYSATFLLGAAIAIEPDVTGLMEFNLPDFTSITDVNPAWQGRPTVYEVFDHCLRVKPGLGSAAEQVRLVSGATTAATQRLTAIRKGDASVAGFTMLICSDGASGHYRLNVANDAVVLFRSGVFQQLVYFASVPAAGVDYTVNTKFVLESVSGVVKAYINDVEVVSFTDPSPITTGYCGVVISDEAARVDSLKFERY